MNRKYHLFDAEGKVLGRLAVEIAKVLSGRNKADFVPRVDSGDFAIVINASKIRVTGNKLNDKIYHKFSGYPGGITSIALKDLLKKDPEKVIKNAVFGMLPKNNLRSKMMLRLKVYGGADHAEKNIDVTH
ncbi:MAG TPA: 50S ribosomal protein L13 [Candidatus Moranbacteria bacterium]|jgi:large subunit ribosomal protein L13|nr:50S ribosomal protein L13 [Candidatus Moranbacteria bacterium]HPX94227.1 50S ribosomal protein L13 [Candidatus Moranbacteria bacterium]HQB59684.1 50S ribosomal protein L13 [Candidatus Moranbacteria bacterium]